MLDVEPGIAARIGRPMPSLSPALEAVIDRHWARAIQGRALFNGQVFSADEVAPDLIVGHWTEYRRVVAQMAEPALFAELSIRSLAVCGALCGPDGVAIGRRHHGSLYLAGQWQLPPAGSVDRSSDRDGTIDLGHALLAELQEELGIDEAAVGTPLPLVLVQHPSGVLDLGLTMTTDLAADAILALHRASGNAEYDRMMVCPAKEIMATVAALGGLVARPTQVLLSRIPALRDEA